MANHVPGTLKVTAIKAYNLPDTDGWLDTADPYALIVAYRSDGPLIIRRTRTIGGNLNPVWNQELTFGYGKWTHLYIRIWDEDGGLNFDNDAMTGDHKVDIIVPCSDTLKIANQIECSYYVDYSL